MDRKLIPPRTVGRLSLYRNVLTKQLAPDAVTIFSHDIARLAAVSPAQVRRDIMSLGYSGSPNRGYEITHLLESIHQALDAPTGVRVALVGLGALGRALMDIYQGRHANLGVVAAFDINPDKTDRLFNGIPVYPMEQLNEIVKEKDILAGIIAVPAERAQPVAEQMIHAGIVSLINYAPITLRLPHSIYLEQMYLSVVMERVAYYAHQSRLRREGREVTGSRLP